jgi:hypothetical protein
MIQRNGQILATFAVLLVFQLLLQGEVQAQDLEPRRWSHLPMGLNVIGVGSGWTDGDILFDPVLLIEDVTFDLYPIGVGYVRTFELFGKSSRVDVVVPYASGRWRGLLDGEFTEVQRRGFADPRVRFSINLWGAPALTGKEFVQYKRAHPVTTTIGAAVQVRVPLGEYTSERLINLGGNRWTVRPQLGVLHQHHKWQFELTGSVFLHQTNDEFWKDTELKQDALWFAQGHAIYTFKSRWWASFSAGYAYGGQAYVNNVPKSNIRARYIALSLGLPISAHQSVKFTYLTSDTHVSSGKNIDALLAAWSINWGM